MKTFHTIGGALRRRHRLVWLPVLAGIAVSGLLAAWMPPSYQATALLGLDEQQEVSLGFDLALQADQYLTQGYVAMATSQPVLERVCATIPHGCDATALAGQVSAGATRAAGVISVSVTARSATRAAALANAVAKQVVAQNQAMAAASAAPTRDYLRTQLEQLSQQQSSIQQQVADFPRGGLSDAAVANATAPILDQLTLVHQQYQATYGKLQDLEVQQARLSSALLVRQTAQVPPRPANPDLTRYLVVAAALGAVAGFLLALVADRLDWRLRDAADLADATGAEVVLDAGPRPAAADCGALLLQAGVQRELLVVAASRDDDVDAVREALAGAAGELGRTLIVSVAAAPALEPRTLLRARTADAAVVVATRGRTASVDARRTAKLLRRVGLQVAGAVLLSPTRQSMLRWRALRKLLSAAQLALPSR